MFIRGRKIIGSRVFTQSGYYLGKVVDFKLDTTGQNIIEYYVSKRFLNPIKRPLIIKSNQVIEIKKGKIIVEDTFIPEVGVEYAR